MSWLLAMGRPRRTHSSGACNARLTLGRQRLQILAQPCVRHQRPAFGAASVTARLARSRQPRHAIQARARHQQDTAESLALLGLDSLGDVKELKQAYYAQMRRLHPDCNSSADGDDATAAAARVNAAYAALLEVRWLASMCAVAAE
jgi:DnaJ domain